MVYKSDAGPCFFNLTAVCISEVWEGTKPCGQMEAGWRLSCGRCTWSPGADGEGRNHSARRAQLSLEGEDWSPHDISSPGRKIKDEGGAWLSETCPVAEVTFFQGTFLEHGSL